MAFKMFAIQKNQNSESQNQDFNAMMIYRIHESLARSMKTSFEMSKKMPTDHDRFIETLAKNGLVMKDGNDFYSPKLSFDSDSGKFLWKMDLIKVDKKSSLTLLTAQEKKDMFRACSSSSSIKSSSLIQSKSP